MHLLFVSTRFERCTTDVPTTGLEALAECSPYIQSIVAVSSMWLLLTSHSPGVDSPYPAVGGIYRDESIMLLRRFYVQENEKGRVLFPVDHFMLAILIFSQRLNRSQKRIDNSTPRLGQPWTTLLEDEFLT